MTPPGPACLDLSLPVMLMNEGSDIDILVDIKKDISLLDFVGLKLELEEALGQKVDLVEYSTIKPVLKERILKSQIPII